MLYFNKTLKWWGKPS